jgi:dimethylargininase
MLTAITRHVSPAIGQCELTYLERVEIDYALACAQHEQYRQALAGLGCRVVNLPALAHLPDSVFVEDTALVLDEVAILTRPGGEITGYRQPPTGLSVWILPSPPLFSARQRWQV